MKETPQPLDKALVKYTLMELVDKWEILVTCYMNFDKARFNEEDEKKCTTRKKFLRKLLMETMHSVSKAIEELDTMTVLCKG